MMMFRMQTVLACSLTLYSLLILAPVRGSSGDDDDNDSNNKGRFPSCSSSTSCHILCKKAGHRLAPSAYLVRLTMVTSVLQCVRACTNHPDCQSVNYHEALGTCELNKMESCHELQENSEYVYMSPRNCPMLSMPQPYTSPLFLSLQSGSLLTIFPLDAARKDTSVQFVQIVYQTNFIAKISPSQLSDSIGTCYQNTDPCSTEELLAVSRPSTTKQSEATGEEITTNSVATEFAASSGIPTNGDSTQTNAPTNTRLSTTKEGTSIAKKDVVTADQSSDTAAPTEITTEELVNDATTTSGMTSYQTSESATKDASATDGRSDITTATYGHSDMMTDTTTSVGDHTTMSSDIPNILSTQLISTTAYWDACGDTLLAFGPHSNLCLQMLWLDAGCSREGLLSPWASLAKVLSWNAMALPAVKADILQIWRDAAWLNDTSDMEDCWKDYLYTPDWLDSILPYPYKYGALAVAGLSCYVFDTYFAALWADCRDTDTLYDSQAFSWDPATQDCAQIKCERGSDYDPHNPPEIDMNGTTYLKTDNIFIKASSIGRDLMSLGVTNSHVEYDTPYILLGALPITGFWVHYSSSEILDLQFQYDGKWPREIFETTGATYEVSFIPGENITVVSGFEEFAINPTKILGLTLITTHRTYGRFGYSEGYPFTRSLSGSSLAYAGKFYESGVLKGMEIYFY